MDLYIKRYCNLNFKSSTEMTECYRNLQADYPKFFKMDNLSKLGFLASEVLLKSIKERFDGREDIAVVCFNRSSSLEIDMMYQKTVQNSENYFPSPSLFVYTLPNIVAGEIAIRNKFYGETSFYVSEKFDAEMIFRISNNVLLDKITNFALCAWIENFEKTFDVRMFLITKEKTDIEFTEQFIDTLNK